MEGSIPMFRLGERGGGGLCCDVRGVALGPIALVEAAEANGRRVYRIRPAEEVARALALACEPFTTDDLARRLSGLDVAARALEAGDMAKAAVATVLMKLPPLSPEAMAKLAGDPTLKKYHPDQPRGAREDRRAAAFAKFNPYHRPAHSPDGTGGQFTDADGAAGGGIKPMPVANRNRQGNSDRGSRTNTGDAQRHPWMTRRNKEFRNFIADEEKSTEHRRETDGYDEKRRNGNALGRYQLQKKEALRQIGWVDENGKWTAKAARHGVTSDKDFLNKRDAQEAAFDLFLSDSERQARSLKITIRGDDGAEQKVSLWDLAQRGQTYDDENGRTTKITPAGIIAAIHRQGGGGTQKFLSRVAANGWTSKGLTNYSEGDRAAAQRLLDAQNVPYTPYNP